jgi:hypothetical protein
MPKDLSRFRGHDRPRLDAGYAAFLTWLESELRARAARSGDICFAIHRAGLQVRCADLSLDRHPQTTTVKLEGSGTREGSIDEGRLSTAKS